MSTHESKRVPPALENLLGELVVVDTDSTFIFLGKLEGADSQFLQISQVDVHDMGKTNLSKERYIHEARKIGVRHNRAHTYIRMDRVICISKLEDVEGFES
jgi:small nuclear ribonucleoprotein (snRNP)-like protein